MSLTKLLDLSDVKAMFRAYFSKPLFETCQEMLAPPLTGNYSLVGTAFDYLLRFYLEQRHPFAKTKGWVASRAPSMLKKDTRVYNVAEQILKDARQHHASYLQNGQLTDELLHSCLLLAQLDPVFRRKAIVPNMGRIDPLDVIDLRNLLTAVSAQTFQPAQVCLLDPTFGIASLLVGGADIDLVVDDALIEIKTSKDPTFQRGYFNQIVGYYILCRLGGIDQAPEKHHIRNLGIYFSRYGRLFMFPVSAIGLEQDFEDFSTWFIARAEQEYGTNFVKLQTLKL